MKLSVYLRERDESINAFAKRSGVPATTVQRVCDGAVCNTVTAYRIVRASRVRRAPGGKSVQLEDLVPRDELEGAGQ